MKPELPEGVGPHEGREFDLIRAGKKDIALFLDWEPEGLEDIMADGFCLLQYGQRTPQGKTYFTRIVFREGYETQALRLKSLTQSPEAGWNDSREHEIGRILGYRIEEVEAFLKHTRRNL